MSAQSQWKKAYRLARIIYNSKPENPIALCRLDKLEYMAWFTVEFKRAERPQTTPAERLWQNKIANEIIDELITEERPCMTIKQN